MSQQSDLIRKALADDIEQLEKKILGGSITSLEQYKNLTGELRGILRARDAAIEAVNIEDDDKDDK